MAEKPRQGKVTVVGAGFYGSTTALRLAEYDVFETVVLTDIVEGKPEGIALDMNQSRPIEGFETKIVGVGGGSYEGTEGSDVVVITAGLPRKPGMSRMDLIETNAKIVRDPSLGDRLAAMAEKSRNGKVTVVGAGFYGSTTASVSRSTTSSRPSCSPTSSRASPRASRST